jgi:hypothetical protein
MSNRSFNDKIEEHGKMKKLNTVYSIQKSDVPLRCTADMEVREMMIISSKSDFDMHYYKKNIIDKAQKIGFNTSCLILQEWDHEIIQIHQKLRRFLRLSKDYSDKRFEKACERAYFYKQETPDIVSYILKRELDLLPLDLNTDIFGQSYSNLNK